MLIFPVKTLPELNQERNMRRSSTVYKQNQSKIKVLNKYDSGFWRERRTEDGLFLLEEALLWIMDEYFSWKQ